MDRTSGVRKVLVYTFLANAVVALAKVAYGYATNSIGMTSDGFHSLFDGVSNILGLVGIWIASRPPDRRHPYGHKKFETLCTLAIATMIFFTCYQILARVYGSFFDHHSITVTPFSFIVMLITMAVNISVMIYEAKKGKELMSDFLIADAKHTKSDIITSVAVIVGLIFSRLGYHHADAVIGIVITLFIARIGYEIIRSASDTLVDTVCIDTLAVENVVTGIAGVMECHDIRTRGAVHSVFLDLHILVDPNLPVKKAHEIADSVEARIKENFSTIVDIVVHMEPGDKQ